MFIVDSSESVRKDGFVKIQDFIANVVKQFTIGPTTTRIGLVLYSEEPELKVTIDRDLTREQIIDEIMALRYIGEGTYTGKAISLATQEAFANAREGVRKVAIVITDGQTDLRDFPTLQLAVEEAREHDIYTHAVGVFNSSHAKINKFLNELKLIATDPDRDVHHIEDFNLLTGDYVL